MTKANDFAEACLDQNTRNELKEALAGEPDVIDMKTWGLTETQWREALGTAIIAIEKDISIDEAIKCIGLKTTTKRRQGQRGATPKPICPKCGDILKRNYTREVINGKQQYVASGWICLSSTCDYIIKAKAEKAVREAKYEIGIEKKTVIKLNGSDVKPKRGHI